MALAVYLKVCTRTSTLGRGEVIITVTVTASALEIHLMVGIILVAARTVSNSTETGGGFLMGGATVAGLIVVFR